jgi:LysE type translocator.
MKRKDLYSLGFGALLSTLFFLSLIALGGSLAKEILSTNIIEILNITVGFLFMCFGIKMIIKG